MHHFKQLREKAIDFLCEEKDKEWYCHVQFVEKISLELAERFGGNKEVVSIAAILHDIGRDKEQPGEDHRETGVRIATEFLKEFDLTELEMDLIFACIKNHGADEVPQSLEEKIIITADSASKVLYHQGFMLMVKKETFVERAEWGLKYLDKGYSKIQFPEYKEELANTYKFYRDIYLEVLKKI